MRKIKYLLLSFLLTLAVLFGGCVASMGDAIDWSETDQNIADGEEESGEEKVDLPLADTDSTEENSEDSGADDEEEEESAVTYGESYTSKEEVALYLHLYGELPPNFITKNEAKNLGWDSSKGNLGKVAPGKSIGGDYFGNREGILPKGKEYHECDIDSDGGYRNAKRIVYSDDGCIYYTEDHYESFELLYGEE